jgi:hypothetical protein
MHKQSANNGLSQIVSNTGRQIGAAALHRPGQHHAVRFSSLLRSGRALAAG